MQKKMIYRELVDVAMGRQPADLVIRNGKWVCVQSGEIIPNTDIAICGERIAYVGHDASHTIGEATQIIDAAGRYLSPGLLDGHLHVESGMLTVTEFVRAVIPHGTTGMFIDPHEIANVFGMAGVRLMLAEAAHQPIHVWVQIPSCVPSAPGFETPGASIGPEDVEEGLGWEGVVGLGEMMNFPAVIQGSAGASQCHVLIEETRSAGKIIGGHYPSLDLGLSFHAYAAGGPQDDHEGTRPEDAIARVRQGMKAMLRYGSAWHDVAAGVRAITDSHLDARNFILCTDDAHCGTLVNEGHVNRAINQAIAHGVPSLTAIQMATINTAEHFGLSREVGQIAPGRFADVLIIDDLNNITPHLVIARGQVVARQKNLLIDLAKYTYPDWVVNSIHIPHPLTPSDFLLQVGQAGHGLPHSQVTANVIGVIENQAPTRHLRYEIQAIQGEIKPDPEQDLAKIAVIERHHHTGRIQIGLVHGFGFNVPCAVGSTVAHDAHHLTVVGTDEGDMALAANELARMGGGQVVVREGRVIGRLNLPIAGLMSNERPEIVAHQAASILAGFKSCGCMLNNPNMQLSLLSLVVIPELRLSDLGLVDVNHFEFIPVLESS